MNDGSIDNGAALFRALVWDATNAPLDASAISYFAGTNSSSVSLFFQDKLDVPLLVDTDKDGYCDDIARGTDGERKPVATLTSIEPTGTAPFAGALVTTDTFGSRGSRRYAIRSCPQDGEVVRLGRPLERLGSGRRDVPVRVDLGHGPSDQA
ncbi:MAG: hypothetical protein QM784_03480 [Polyangiaceae bacterium]